MNVHLNYWDNWYTRGGNSGEGSRGYYRIWKWHCIKKYVDIHNCSVIDVGCGDLDFWKERDCKHYIGIDVSPTKIKINQKKKPTWNFICSDASEYHTLPPADVVFCHDMLFHIMDDGTYNGILNNLTRYSDKFIFIYTWLVNPLEPRTDDSRYQKYRDFNLYIPIFETAGFELVKMIPSPKIIDKYGAMWIFKRK